MMEIVIIILQLILIVGAIIIYFSLPAYLKKKGENLATKEDIEEITQKIEGVKSSFDKSKIKFTYYHQKQSAIIAEFYKLLQNCVQEMINYSIHVMPTPNSDSLIKRSWVTEKINTLNNYFDENRIFFNETTITQYYKLLPEIQRLNANFDGLKFNNVNYNERVNLWNEFHRELLVSTFQKFYDLSTNLRDNLIGECIE